MILIMILMMTVLMMDENGGHDDDNLLFTIIYLPNIYLTYVSEAALYNAKCHHEWIITINWQNQQHK